jgi:hypothetical protein
VGQVESGLGIGVRVGRPSLADIDAVPLRGPDPRQSEQRVFLDGAFKKSFRRRKRFAIEP